MANYIDGFVFPIAVKHLDAYRKVAVEVAEIWKEYGALSYSEFVGNDLSLEGTRSFQDAVTTNKEEVVIFGWVVFPSKEVRDTANKQVPEDERMHKLVAPLVDPDRMIFDSSRMLYGGFKSFI